MPNEGKKRGYAASAVRAFAFAAIAALATAARAVAAEVAVLAHDPGYYTSLAKHVQRWLAQHDIASELAAPSGMSAALSDAKVAFLVGFDAPTDAEMKVIEGYRARGGRLVVFYSSSPRLAALMGVKVLGFAKAAYPGQWSRMDFSVNFPEGLPRRVLQTSTVLQKAEPLPGKGRVMATWSDRSGRPTGDAAWISTSSGYWMTHVLLADGDEALKAQTLAAMTGCLAPGLWNWEKFKVREAEERRALAEFAAAQVPQKGEIHAVWDHSGCGLYPGDWPRTIRLLKTSGVTDLFVNVAGAGFAHYPSKVLPRSRTYEQEGDQLKACLAAAAGSGIRVHAWVLCFTATRSTPERMEKFKADGWRLKDRNGRLTEYLDPSKPAVRKRILEAIDELQAKYAIDGIHIDFVRWYERAEKPKDAADIISKFVAEVRKHVKRPRLLTAAVLGKYPACVASVGQDWNGWLDTGSVDYVVPMDYTEDPVKFASFLAQHALKKSHARKTIVGIGVTANESRLGAREVIGQLKMARACGFPGAALFDLDTTLEKQILPYLRQGMWRADSAR